VIFVFFFALAVRFWGHNLLDADDMRWLKQIGDVLGGREEKLPEIGRYNAGQKLFFFVAVLCILLLLLSGIVIWRRYFSAMFPVGVIRIAALVHAVAAFVVIIGVIVHIYAAIWVKGSVRAMVRGTVTLGWARKHHVKWFRQSVK
jgi:formate dehydrogenase subunit gamma